MSTPIADTFSALPTAAISDALDSLGLVGQCLGILPLHSGARLVGRAFTVRYRAVGVIAPGTVGDYIDDVPSGEVCVLDNGGRLDCTVWGDILTMAAHRRGVAGTVINGVCRDVTRAHELRYPVFSCGYTMRTGKGRVELAAIGEPVSMGNVQVRRGDLVIGDADGVIVVPREREDEVLAAARAIEDAERAIEKEVSSGTLVSEARRRHRYHELQSR